MRSKTPRYPASGVEDFMEWVTDSDLVGDFQDFMEEFFAVFEEMTDIPMREALESGGQAAYSNVLGAAPSSTSCRYGSSWASTTCASRLWLLGSAGRCYRFEITQHLPVSRLRSQA